MHNSTLCKKKKMFRTGYWLFKTIKSKLTNWASNPCFYWLHFHNVKKIVILLYQYLNIWDSFFLSGIVITDSSWWVLMLAMLFGSPSTSSWVVKTVHCCLPGLLHGEVVSVAIRDGNFTSYWWVFYSPRQLRVLTGHNLKGVSGTEGTEVTF